MIKICLFGAGRIGAIHAANVAAHPNARLVYVVDVFEQSAQNLANQHGARVASVEQALADPDIQAVIIASSTDTHADLIEQSARAGKAIFCEKPIDLNLERTRQCLDTLASSGVTCLVGFNRRYDPQFSELKARLERGDIGQVEMVTITSRDPSPPPAQYVQSSGGLFRDMMIHDLDMALWLLGEPVVEVFATASCLIDPAIGAAGDVDSALVTLKTAGGKLCQISNSRRAAYGYDQRIEVLGALGMLQANNQLESNLVLTTDQGSRGAKPEYFFLQRYADAYRRELEHFLDILDTGATALTKAQDGFNALALAEAALTSAGSGRAVSL